MPALILARLHLEQIAADLKLPNKKARCNWNKQSTSKDKNCGNLDISGLAGIDQLPGECLRVPGGNFWKTGFGPLAGEEFEFQVWCGAHLKAPHETKTTFSVERHILKKCNYFGFLVANSISFIARLHCEKSILYLVPSKSILGVGGFDHSAMNKKKQTAC